jgi:Ca2+-binding EF-hand superfamily protein
MLEDLLAAPAEELALGNDEVIFCGELFREFDLDKDERLSLGETKLLLAHLASIGRIEPLPNLAKQAVAAFNSNGDHYLTLSDFLHFFSSAKKRWPDGKREELATSAGPEERRASTSTDDIDTASTYSVGVLALATRDLKDIFDRIDVYRAGKLAEKELKQLLATIGIPDYEGDKFHGFISRAARLKLSSKAKRDLNFVQFKALIDSLVNCAVDRAHRAKIVKTRNYYS